MHAEALVPSGRTQKGVHHVVHIAALKSLCPHQNRAGRSVSWHADCVRADDDGGRPTVARRPIARILTISGLNVLTKRAAPRPATTPAAQAGAWATLDIAYKAPLYWLLLANNHFWSAFMVKEIDGTEPARLLLSRLLTATA